MLPTRNPVTRVGSVARPALANDEWVAHAQLQINVEIGRALCVGSASAIETFARLRAGSGEFERLPTGGISGASEELRSGVRSFARDAADHRRSAGRALHFGR